MCWFYLDEYDLDEAENYDVINALSFYKNFFSGVFVDNINDMIVVNSTSYSVWKYEESTVGERAVGKRLLSEPKGTFACPGKGFWPSSYFSKFKIENYDYLGSMAKVRRVI